MKHKGTPESKIPTTKTNTNKKRATESHNSGRKISISLLKKNEFALIILGALLLTIIIFFLFFRSSDPQIQPIKKNIANSSFTRLEKRIEKVEALLKINKNSKGLSSGHIPEGVTRMNPMDERLTRLETAFLVKFDSLIERMEKIEKNISLLKNKMAAVAIAKAKAKPKSKPSIPVKKAVKKPVQKEKKVSMFHTVQKGETLYFISKKYSTSIADLRKLNNLSTNAKIYPGDNILVR